MENLSQFEILLIELTRLQNVNQDIVFRSYVGWNEENSLTCNCLEVTIDLQQSTFTYCDDSITMRVWDEDQAMMRDFPLENNDKVLEIINICL